MRYLLALLTVSFFFCSSPTDPTPTPPSLIAFTIIADSTSRDYRYAVGTGDPLFAERYHWTQILNGNEYEGGMKFGATLIVHVPEGTTLTAKIMRLTEGRYMSVGSRVAHADSTWKIKNDL